MAGNPPDSPWRSTPKEKRISKTHTLTVTDETWEAAKELAARRGISVSKLFEILVLEQKDG